jgi:hypothetical protein
LGNHLYSYWEVNSANQFAQQEAPPGSTGMTASNSSSYYLACMPSKAPNVSSATSYMHSLGCSSFNRFFWRVPVCRLKTVLSRHELENAIVLRRSRSVIGHIVDGRDGLLRLGSLIVIAYRLDKPSRKVRKAVQRALQKAPCFKLCPSVYAFPQLRRTRTIRPQTTVGRRGNKPSVITHREFVDILSGLGARIFRLSKLVLLDQRMERDLVEHMVSTRRTQCRKMAQACKNLVSSTHLQGGEYFSIRAQKLKLFEIKYRYRSTRAVLSFFRREMSIDLFDELVRASRAISLCHKALRSAEEMRASAAAELAH